LGKSALIDESAKTITLCLPSGSNLSISYSPSIVLSDKATLLTSLPCMFYNGVALPFTVKAEDGTTSTYQVTVTIAVTTGDFNTQEPEIKVFATNRSIVVKYSKALIYSVFGVNGDFIENGMTDPGEYTLSKTYQPGVYLVLINGKVHKISVQ
jgi:hypothetical protein